MLGNNNRSAMNMVSIKVTNSCNDTYINHISLSHKQAKKKSFQSSKIIETYLQNVELVKLP